MKDIFTKEYLLELGFKCYSDLKAVERCEDLVCAINNTLIEEYPFLCLTTNRNSNKHDATWLDLIPDGWRTSIMEDFCKELKKILVKNKLLDDFYITDLKEKYGKLVFNPNIYIPQIEKLQEKYEIKSMMHCQVCGEYTKYSTKGWIMYLCKDCYKEYTKGKVYKDDLLTWNDIPRWWRVSYNPIKHKQIIKHSPLMLTHIKAMTLWKMPKK